eukprot:XP_011664812.1 PREDICTED: cell wall protein DAN4-like [Strongylocentrotus purpuratus]
MNHASAVSACSQYGSHLVFINSQEEQNYIVGIASEGRWIGLTGSSPTLPVLSDLSKLTKTSCLDEFIILQSTLPASYQCKMVRLPNGTMLQTVPKLFSPPAVIAGKNPGQHIICRIPESVTTEATTLPATSPTTTVSEQPHTMTLQKTTIIESRESSTTNATTKRTTSSSTTMSDTTTSQETTTSSIIPCSQYGSHLVFIESQEEQNYIVGIASEGRWIGLTGSSPNEARIYSTSQLDEHKHMTSEELLHSTIMCNTILTVSRRFFDCIR